MPRQGQFSAILLEDESKRTGWKEDGSLRRKEEKERKQIQSDMKFRDEAMLDLHTAL